MNHTMDIFWTCFDSLGGVQWCMSLVEAAGTGISGVFGYIENIIGGLLK